MPLPMSNPGALITTVGLLGHDLLSELREQTLALGAWPAAERDRPEDVAA